MIEEDLRLKAAWDARAKFLTEHPELMSFQNEIDSALKTVGWDPIARSYLLQTMMCKASDNLREKMVELVDIVDSSVNGRILDIIKRSS